MRENPHRMWFLKKPLTTFHLQPMLQQSVKGSSYRPGKRSAPSPSRRRYARAGDDINRMQDLYPRAKHAVGKGLFYYPGATRSVGGSHPCQTVSHTSHSHQPHCRQIFISSPRPAPLHHGHPLHGLETGGILYFRHTLRQSGSYFPPPHTTGEMPRSHTHQGGSHDTDKKTGPKRN